MAVSNVRYRFEGNTGIGTLPDGTKFLFDKNRFDRIRDTKWYRNYREPGHRKLYLIDRHGNYLHRVLCDCPPGYEVDHISLDTLDNRSENLRVVTHQQNQINHSLQRNNSSGVSGVDFYPRNEKYCGDLLLQKYYVVDVLSHKLAKNEGQLPQYFVENAHEPIIPKEVFYQVQGELQRRSMLKNDPGKFRYGAKDALTGRLVCGKCGRKLKRYTNPDPMLTDWRCRNRAYEKKSMTKEVEAKCDCRNANEREVEAAVVVAFNELPGLRDEMLRTQGALRDGDLKRIDTMIEGNQEQQGRLTERLDSLADPNSEEASFLNGELARLEEERMALMLERAEAAHREVKIRLLLELIDAMKEKHDESYGIVHEREEDSGEGACYDYDEFFRRTRMELADEVPRDGGAQRPV